MNAIPLPNNLLNRSWKFLVVKMQSSWIFNLFLVLSKNHPKRKSSAAHLKIAIITRRSHNTRKTLKCKLPKALLNSQWNRKVRIAGELSCPENVFSKCQNIFRSLVDKYDNYPLTSNKQATFIFYLLKFTRLSLSIIFLQRPRQPWTWLSQYFNNNFLLRVRY